MENIITVDREKCLKDGLCMADCPAKILLKDEDGYPVPIQNADEICIDCGHCVAVCPSGALDHRKMANADCRPIQKELGITPQQMEQYLCARRSIRQYRQKPVDRQQIEKLLEIAGCAPSGHNAQPAQWVVYSGFEAVRGLAGMVADWMRELIINEPEFAALLHMDRVIAAWDQGVDRILRDAPHLIVGHAHKDERTAPAAIVTAIAYLELAAPALGLGTCWAGYFNGASQVFEPLQRALALPEDHAVFGAVMLGYPKARYHRIPLRKPVDVIWR